jgi:mRNA-degrading endonuclease toxin of MazEF toxin-antitoxin module
MVLKQGSIVQARVYDPQGQNPKVRPLVVITPTPEIGAAAQFVAVAISGRFSTPLADDEVPLPYHPAGKANSGLRKPCVAKCSWLVTLAQADVVAEKGFLTAERLDAVLRAVGRLNRE